ncbi:hypothetical protein [Flavihumibacter sp. CACIAM 22H1]|uniref:hypothetical protein n=1 Tax=Flavihumibacter sp. CACIAM 22H1 TaxID=1812911 RepID=UPI0007A9037C|nr:hypothetical protein [Flavihumibacter sp. CACIAM 22H1]KYP13618.1 MAG: hypothetical protein A1D16_08475 [Flavihumibacter sp. CACIAM 22H1]
METREKDFNLVDGCFTNADAKEILATLFSDKIHFHQLRNFSHEERFGKPDAHAMERIPVLKKTLQETLAFLQTYEEETEFEILADIRIKAVVPVPYVD